MQHFDWHNERGRSMVEMLGVLAVVGVLSIAGLAGFKAAIQKCDPMNYGMPQINAQSLWLLKSI